MDVTFSAVVASPGGTARDAPVVWSLCTEPRPLTENGSVSTACLRELPTVGEPGSGLQLRLPADACARFGPDTPPGDFRPRDPDATGGYYQPVAARLEGATTFGFERLRCNAASVSNQVAQDYATRYVPNLNPGSASLTAKISNALIPFDRIPTSAQVRLEVAWPEDAREEYLSIDVVSQSVVSLREAVQVSWFVTAGRLSTARTGSPPDDPAVTSGNLWVAPSKPGPVYLWVILRDSRGGAAFAAQQVEVVP